LESFDTVKQPQIDLLSTSKGVNLENNALDKLQKNYTKTGGRLSGKPQCWECGSTDHRRDACPNLIPKTQANTVRITCMSLVSSNPYTVEGTVGDTPVSRMLIDSGADISLIARNMLPKATRLGKPIWVEGVGDRSQLYRTAKVRVTIRGVQTEVLMAVAPTEHIPYSVVLGRNVPGLTLHWTLRGEDKTVPVVSSDLTQRDSSKQTARS